MKQVSELSREQLEEIAVQIRDILWQDPISDALDPDRSWSVETLERVSGVIEEAGLKPDPVPVESPAITDDVESQDAAMRSALETFIETIEATGGCLRPTGVIIGPGAEEVIDFEGSRPVPAGDEGWPDLADAYIFACRALGREPMIQDEDADALDSLECPGGAWRPGTRTSTPFPISLRRVITIYPWRRPASLVDRRAPCIRRRHAQGD